VVQLRRVYNAAEVCLVDATGIRAEVVVLEDPHQNILIRHERFVLRYLEGQRRSLPIGRALRDRQRYTKALEQLGQLGGEDEATRGRVTASPDPGEDLDVNR
jgi:hypothetical protein